MGDGGTLGRTRRPHPAIDRSTKMIEMAAMRNRACVAGRAAFRAVSLEEADLGDARFGAVAIA
jgi:hypothetical protein